MITRGLLVTSQFDHTVREYDGTTGAFVRVAASGPGRSSRRRYRSRRQPARLGWSGQPGEAVRQWDRRVHRRVCVSQPGRPNGHDHPPGRALRNQLEPPQGVQKFDATTGVNTGNFVPSIANASPRDVKVNPANNRLYVLYYNAATVETFDLTTMASFGLLMPAGSPLGSGGLYTPSAMAFGPDGNLYIYGGTFGGNLGVRRYNPTTGAFIDFFANTGSDLYSPIGITFGPDNNLYVATSAANVMRFNYPAGTFMDFFVPDGGGGLTVPFHLTFGVGPS